MRKIGAMMKLGGSTDVDLEIKKVRDMELDSCQLCVWDQKFFTDDRVAEVKEATSKYGIEISSLWAGWDGPCEWNFTYGPSTIGLVPPAYRYARLKQLMKASEFAAKLGIKNVITHVGFIPEDPADPEFAGTVGALRKLATVMKARGQYFLFETGQETPVTMLRTIQAIGTDNLGINFDTANLLLYGKANSLDALDVFGQYVMDTHIKDGFYPTDGMKLGRQVQVGEGKADIPAIIRKLDELGYTGAYTIEREISGEKQIQDIVATRDYLRQAFAEIDG